MNGNLYLLFGIDYYLMKKRTEQLFAEQGIDAIDVEFFDMEETLVEEAVNAAMTIPFLSEKKAVVLKNCSFFSAVKPPKELDHLFAYLTRYLRNPNPTTLMILQAPYDKLDTRKQVFKIAQETCHIEECAALKKEDIYPLIKTALEKAGKHMDANALEEFVNRTSDNSFLALNELDKLLLYADDLKNINIDIVRRVTTRNLEDNIFELVNAIIAKESKQVTRIYQDLAEVNTDPTAILSLIIGKFQEILYSKELLRMNTSFEDIMKYFNASKGRTYYIVKNAREVSNQQLEKYMQDIEKVDFQIKSGAIDKKMGLEFFLLGI